LYKEKALQGVGQAFVVSAVQVLMRDREIITDGFATRDADTISYMDVVVVDGVVRQIAQIGKQADFSIRYMEVYLK